MDQKLISVLYFVSAVCCVSAYVPHRYHFVNENKSWSEAQSYCRQKYTDLATISDMEEMKKLNASLEDKTRSKVWIGLHKEGDGTWQWSLQDRHLYSEGDTYSNWTSGEPNNANKNEYCAGMYTNCGTWLDQGCWNEFPFVCYNERNTTKPYVLINEPKTWSDAQSYCRMNYTGLVSVRNQTENNLICVLSKQSSCYMVWIGLFKNVWKWSDQSKFSFQYWAFPWPKKQDGNCTAVSMTDQGRWLDVLCETKNPFICYENQLILIVQNLTWREALRYCRNNYVDLVSVHSEKIQLWVKDVVKKASTEHVWLGLRHTCTLSFWYWVRGESLCYHNWAPGNGTGQEDCSSVERTGAVQSGGEQQWISLPEYQRNNFICTTYED